MAPPARPRPTIYRASLNARYLRGLGDVLQNLQSRRELLLDARAADRFYARVPEPRAGLRSGHVPGSRNLPYTELLSAEQTLLAPPQLRERFQARGVDQHTAVVTSCGSGLTAAVLSLGLQVAGLPMGGVVRRILERVGCPCRYTDRSVNARLALQSDAWRACARWLRVARNSNDDGCMDAQLPAPSDSARPAAAPARSTACESSRCSNSARYCC